MEFHTVEKIVCSNQTIDTIIYWGIAKWYGRGLWSLYSLVRVQLPQLNRHWKMVMCCKTRYKIQRLRRKPHNGCRQEFSTITKMTAVFATMQLAVVMNSVMCSAHRDGASTIPVIHNASFRWVKPLSVRADCSHSRCGSQGKTMMYKFLFFLTGYIARRNVGIEGYVFRWIIAATI